FCGELHRAWIADGSYLPERRACDIQTGKASKVRMAQNIEEFSPQLEPKVFLEAQIFDRCKIKARRRGPIDHAASRGSRRVWQPGRRVGRIGLETGCVEPLRCRVWRIFVRIAKKIWSCRRVGKDQPETGVIKI